MGFQKASIDIGEYMTEQEIIQAEKFLSEIGKIRNDAKLKGSRYYTAAKTIEGKIKSCFSSFNPQGYSWQSIALSINCNIDVTKSVDDALDIMHECLQSILNRIPKYDLICRLRNDISYGKRIGVQYHRGFIEEKVPYYSAYFSFPNEVEELMTNWRSGKEADEEHEESIFRLTLATMEQQVDLLLGIGEKKQGEGSVVPKQSIIVAPTFNQNQTVQVNTEISIENCLKELDDCEALSEEELDAIKKQLSEIQELLKDKKGKKKNIREKIASILKWMAEKTTDVMIAVLPTIVTILSNVK